MVVGEGVGVGLHGTVAVDGGRSAFGVIGGGGTGGIHGEVE